MFRLSDERRMLLPSPLPLKVQVSSESTEKPLIWSNQEFSELKFTNHCISSEPINSRTWPSESESLEEVLLTRSSPSDKLFPEHSSHIIRNIMMNNQKLSLKNFFCNTTGTSWSLMTEDVNLRSTEEREPEQDSRNLTDDSFKPISHTRVFIDLNSLLALAINPL